MLKLKQQLAHAIHFRRSFRSLFRSLFWSRDVIFGNRIDRKLSTLVLGVLGDPMSSGIYHFNRR